MMISEKLIIRFLVLYLLVCLPNVVNAQTSFIYDWAKRIGSSGDDAAYSIVLDASDNVYITGQFDGTVDFDPSASTANLTSNGNTDIFIAKYDNNGNYVWAKNIGGTGGDYGRFITTDVSGNVYVTGDFSGTNVDFDPGAGTENLSSNGGQDIFIAKYDNNGNYVWAKKIGGTSGDVGYSIVLDGFGSVYVTGQFQGTNVDFDPGAGTANLTSNGNTDIFIAKYDNNGNYVWAKNIGNTGGDLARSIKTDVTGNVYITGYFSGIVDFDPSASIANLTSNGNYDIFIAKYDNSGNYVWAKNIGGTNYDYGYSIILDASGNVFATGSFNGIVDFDPGAGTANLTSNGSDDIFIAKYDNNGNYVWAKNMGGSTADAGYSIALDAANNIYVTGYFTGPAADFDPGTGTYNLASSGVTDIFFAKYDASGNYVDAVAVGATNADYGWGIAVGATGAIYATGRFAGTVDFDPSAATHNLVSAGSASDVFVAKYFSDPIALPVELVTFEIYCQTYSQQIKWATASEQNSNYFLVERSLNGYNWSEIRNVPAQGHSNQLVHYEVVDDSTIWATNVYYRLKQYDLNGVYKTYSPKATNCKVPENGILVYPNPAEGNFNVELNTFAVEIYTKNTYRDVVLTIHDNLGRLIVDKEIDELSGIMILNFDSFNFAAGMYVVTLQNVPADFFRPVKFTVK